MIENNILDFNQLALHFGVFFWSVIAFWSSKNTLIFNYVVGNFYSCYLGLGEKGKFKSKISHIIHNFQNWIYTK